MLQQHAPHVFTLSTSPHRHSSTVLQQPPRGILKKPTSNPPAPSCSTPSSSRSSPAMSPKRDSFAISGYRPLQWSVVGIAKDQQRRSSSTSTSSSTSLTVTLLYIPTQTLYAWPFNLSSPDAKGVCYETLYTDKSDGAVQTPPEGTMSTSLRVLTDVIRCWMKIRRERSALAKRKGSDGSATSATSSATSTIDAVVDNDEVIDEIILDLRLHQLTPFERSIHLLRQKLPERTGSEDQKRFSSSSSSPSSPGPDSDRDSRCRSSSSASSSASSRASTVEASPEDALRTRKASSPKLPKLNTALPTTPPSPVPQIRLVEATPQEADYEERDRMLGAATSPSISRNGSYAGANMDTVHEDESEEIGESSHDSGEVTFIKVHPCDRADSEPTSPKTTTSPVSSPSKSSRRAIPSPTKVFFRDPFKTSDRATSKPSIKVEAIEYGSPESLLASTSRNKAKSIRRPSFEGLRSRLGGRAKPQ